MRMREIMQKIDGNGLLDLIVDPAKMDADILKSLVVSFTQPHAEPKTPDFHYLMYGDVIGDEEKELRMELLRAEVEEVRAKSNKTNADARSTNQTINTRNRQTQSHRDGDWR